METIGSFVSFQTRQNTQTLNKMFCRSNWKLMDHHILNRLSDRCLSFLQGWGKNGLSTDDGDKNCPFSEIGIHQGHPRAHFSCGGEWQNTSGQDGTPIRDSKHQHGNHRQRSFRGRSTTFGQGEIYRFPEVWSLTLDSIAAGCHLLYLYGDFRSVLFVVMISVLVVQSDWGDFNKISGKIWISFTLDKHWNELIQMKNSNSIKWPANSGHIANVKQTTFSERTRWASPQSNIDIV